MVMMMYSYNISCLRNIIRKLYPFEVNSTYFLFDVEKIKVATISKDLFLFINEVAKELSSAKSVEIYDIYLEELLNFAERKPVLPRSRRPNITNEHLYFTNLKSLQDLTLVVCEDCNLRCEYCYLIEKLNKRSYMNKAVCLKALKLFFEHAQSPIHISFYGGEPLLNFDIIKSATLYALEEAKKRNMKCSFGLVTNGTICSEDIFAFLNHHKFIVNISLDGPAEIHDRFRKFKSGKSTFDVILNNIKRYYSRYQNKNLVRFSPSIFHENYEKIEYLYNFFKTLENGYGISFNIFGDLKCVEDREGFKDHRNKNYFSMLFKYGELLLNEAKTSGSWRDCFTNVRLPTEFFRSVFLNKRLSFPCGAGIKSIIVYPNGDMGGCRQLDPTICRGVNLSWGNVFSNEINDELRMKPVKASLSLSESCAECFLKNICPGFCPAYAYHANSNFENPDPFICETQRTYFKISMWLVAKALELGIPIAKELLDYRISYGGA